MKPLLLSILILLLLSTPIFAQDATTQATPKSPEGFDPFPENKGTNYEYDNEDPLGVCFFPVEKARWDGYKITNKNWHQLTDFQKTMFLTEATEEIEKYENATVDFHGGWGTLIALNTLVAKMEEEFPDAELPMIKLLLETLIKSDYIEWYSNEDGAVE